MKLNKHEVIFFNGDSITDCGRDREDRHSLSGYVKMIADGLKRKFPSGMFEIFNRGISGDRSKEVSARIEAELADIKPTVFVMLLGINDTWRFYDENNPTSPQEYYDNMEKILSAVKKYTDRIILMEPFIGGEDEEKIKFYDDLYLKIIALRTLAKKIGAEYIALDGIFAEQRMITDEPLTEDGIHPTKAGQKLIADRVLRLFQ